ncbi:MAG: peptidoglycan DD-metalloendopeptidase family protein, partial [Parvularculaceae bacterium]|nr:peptidoglycan DD-metalloendopeptidase family protein [Parvularculaceae bacterium]
MTEYAAAGDDRSRARADSRAPWAIAASMSVMVGGAIFLAYAMGLSTARQHDLPPQTPGLSASASERPAGPVTMGAAPTQPTQSQQVAARQVAPANSVSQTSSDDASAMDEVVALAFGTPPRLNPALASAAVADAGTESRLTPRLKPSLGDEPAPSLAVAAPQVVRLAATQMASEDDGPPPVFFESDLVADRTPPPPPALAYQGDMAGAPHEVTVSLAKGETFVDALKRAHISAQDRNAAAYAFGDYYNLRTLRPGQAFALTVAEPNRTLFQLVSSDDPQSMQLLALDFRIDAENRISLKRDADGSFIGEKHTAPLTTRLAAIEGRIDGSLYLSAKRQGAPDEVIAGLADMFAYDIDFQREIFGGDEFEAIFEVRYDETGRMAGAGDILYGRMKWRGRAKEKGYYRFASAENGGRADYFDAKGESARRLLMKTPIDGARLSSGFGTRRHPILGYKKAHKGVDFAAPRGTPIKAAGDGVVERAGPYGSFGNYIRIRHANNYKTAYAHLHAIKKGVRAGNRVRQGDIIGYVGTTGRSTGPHLHYEVHLGGKQVNPQNLKIATGVELKGSDLASFRLTRDRIDAMRTPHVEAEAPASLLAERSANGDSL